MKVQETEEPANILDRLIRYSDSVRLFIKYTISKKMLYLLGKNVYIHPTVAFNIPNKIRISDDCKLYQGVILNARSSHEIGIQLGKGVKIHEYSYVDSYGGNVHLDDYVGIGHHCIIGGHGGLTVGKYTMISGLTYIVPANHNYDRRNVPYLHQGETCKGIKIGNNVWIGAGCTILDGVSIGDNAVIGAGAIVSKDIPENTLALGVPAKVIRQL